MAIRIAIEINRTFDVESDFITVFDLLADVPASASFFPKLDKLEPLGDNAYRWEMEKIGVDRHSIQTAYACRYVPDRDAGTVTWSPIEGEGNGIVSGKWQLRENGDRQTHLVFKTQAELTLPLPALLKLAVSPIVKHEFNALVDQYMRRLQQHFNAA